MANFIVMELAKDPKDSNKWFYTGRSFIATSTGKNVDELKQSKFFCANFNRQCDEEFGTWEGVEILPFPNTTNQPTMVKVLDYALPVMM